MAPLNKSTVLLFLVRQDKPCSLDEIRGGLGSSHRYSPSPTKRVLRALQKDEAVRQVGEKWEAVFFED